MTHERPTPPKTTVIRIGRQWPFIRAEKIDQPRSEHLGFAIGSAVLLILVLVNAGGALALHLLGVIAGVLFGWSLQAYLIHDDLYATDGDAGDGGGES